MQENITEYRRELKGRILVAATQLFFQYGIKKVRMDDIAKKLRISKRTLYEIYQSKEEVLIASLHRFHDENHARLEASLPKDASVMDVLTTVYRNQLEISANVNPVFYDDLNDYTVVKKYLKSTSLERTEKARKFFLKGVEQGYFLEDINDDLVSEIASYINESVAKCHLYHRYPTEDIFRHMMILFIRGFCTVKGVEEIDKILMDKG